jgi:putative two-component system response regulator
VADSGLCTPRPPSKVAKILEPYGAAAADVFDALTSDRVYRAALPIKSAIEMMQDERGRHFDPELLDAFFLALGEIEAIRHAYSD